MAKKLATGEKAVAGMMQVGSGREDETDSGAGLEIMIRALRSMKRVAQSPKF